VLEPHSALGEARKGFFFGAGETGLALSYENAPQRGQTLGGYFQDILLEKGPAFRAPNDQFVSQQESMAM
jgi:hypothetical protein